jgi:nitroreductase
MNAQEAIRIRRSVRDFRNESIPGHAVEALIEALRLAPSAGNLQSRKFYFMTNAEMKAKLASAALNQNFISRAPLVVVAGIDKSISDRYGDRGVNLTQFRMCRSAS